MKYTHFRLWNKPAQRHEYYENGRTVELELYTGCKDVNNNKIYLGDIVRATAYNHTKNKEHGGVWTDILGEITLEFGLFGVYDTKNKRHYPLLTLGPCKVIGNKHEQKESKEEKGYKGVF